MAIACTKFMQDDRIKRRLSAGSRGSFIIIHFFHTKGSPQFLEFRMVGNLNRYSKTTNSHQNMLHPSKYIKLDNIDPRSQELIELEKLSKPGSISVITGPNEYMWYKSNSVQKWIREIYKKVKSGKRSNSKKSISSTNRISLNTISSLGKLGDTINASHDTFQDCINAAKNNGPDIMQYQRNLDFQENFHQNVQQFRTRNNHPMASIWGSTRKVKQLSMTKSNTLTKLKPYTSVDFNKTKIQNRGHKNSYMKTINLAYIPRPTDTLNSSWASSKNVDSSDIVLKGDVINGSKNSCSRVASSLKTLQINSSMHHIRNSMNANSNDRYHDQKEQEWLYSDLRSSKNSNKIYSQAPKMDFVKQNQEQKIMINHLQKELEELKQKLQHYETTWKCSIKVESKDQATETDVITFDDLN